MKIRVSIVSLFIFFCLLCAQTPKSWAEEKIKIVITTSTFASIAAEVARDQAEIHSIASPNRDIHFISPTPRDVLKTRKADVFIHGGLDLEVWRGPLLDAVGRPEFLDGSKAIDVSKGISLLEVPQTLSRLEGDVHASGNPHYWMAPENAGKIAENIADGLSHIYPERAAVFAENAIKFRRRLEEKSAVWEQRMRPYENNAVVTYHNSWPYFLERFKLLCLANLEPKPGIPPTGKHLQEVVNLMKEKNAKIIIKQSFHESRAPKKVAEQTGAAVVTLYQETGEVKGDYFDLIDRDIDEIVKAFKGRRDLSS